MTAGDGAARRGARATSTRCGRRASTPSCSAARTTRCSPGSIAYVMGDDVTLVSSAEETAKDVYRTLVAHGAGPARRPARARAPRSWPPGPASRSRGSARRFLGPEVRATAESGAGSSREAHRGRLLRVVPGPRVAASCYLVEARRRRRAHLAGAARPGQRCARAAAAARRPRATWTPSCSATCTPTTAWTCAGCTSRSSYAPGGPPPCRCRSTAPRAPLERLAQAYGLPERARR